MTFFIFTQERYSVVRVIQRWESLVTAVQQEERGGFSDLLLAQGSLVIKFDIGEG